VRRCRPDYSMLSDAYRGWRLVNDRNDEAGAHRSVAIIADARLRNDHDIVTERLLSISGEDTLTVDRKYKEAWIGRIPSRIVILTNELPRLSDSSGALANRFVILQFAESFLGREDHGLGDALLSELPSIFNWALDGLERLNERGRFVQPASSAATMRELATWHRRSRRSSRTAANSIPQPRSQSATSTPHTGPGATKTAATPHPRRRSDGTYAPPTPPSRPAKLRRHPTATTSASDSDPAWAAGDRKRVKTRSQSLFQGPTDPVRV
jgi:hypothetical protein